MEGEQGREGREEVAPMSEGVDDRDRDERREKRSDRRDRHKDDGGEKEDDKKSRSSRSSSSRSSRSSSSSRKRSHSRERDRDRDRHKRKRSRSRSRSPKGRSKDRERSPRSHRHSSRSSKRSHSRSRSRTPSPPRRKRKSANWDKAPVGFEGMNVAQVAQVNPAVLMPLLATQNPQQTRQARRLYVGNIPLDISDQELIDFFNTAMTSSGVPLKVSPPVMGAQLNLEKSFAFLEFAATEDATAGMALDGITLQGQSLKVRRPKDYVAPPAQAEVYTAPSVHIPGIVSTNVPDSPNKIFIGGLPSYLNEEQVKELVSSFGPLKSFNLVKDSETGNSKGYAFFEYLDANVTDRACQGLNNMKLGDKTLLVQRAHLGVAQQDTASLLSLPIGITALTNPTAANFLNLSIPAATLLGGMLSGTQDSSSSPETKVVQLLNMLTAEQLVDDNEYQDIYEDVQQECEKYGRVLSVTIPRPRVVDGKLDPSVIVHAVGRIFVEYSSKEEAVKAQQMLGGRKFNNRTILTSFYDEDLYDMRDFSQH